ncbi:MAG: hypothetical protein ABI905_13650 [Betaproteobacteria bacterium]
MPALRVSLDGTILVTISTSDFDVVHAGVSGSRMRGDPAELEIHAARFGENRETYVLAWATEVAVLPGQTVSIAMLAQADTSPAGKTIEELYREPLPGASTPKSMEQMLAELAMQPLQHEGFAFRLDTGKGDAVAGKTSPDELGFSLGVTWVPEQPERARISLHTYTLQNLHGKKPMNYHRVEKMQCGDEIRFDMLAP